MKDVILNLLSEMLGTDCSSLPGDMKLEDIPGFDSLQFVVLISELQERHGISLPIDKALEMHTLSELVGCVEDLTKKKEH